MNIIRNKISEYIQKTEIINIVIIFIIISGIIIRTKVLLINESFWYDTCALASNLQKTYIEFFKPLDFFQVAPPLFMTISKFLCNLLFSGNSIEQKDFILRLIPYFTSILSLPLFVILTQKIYNNKVFTAFALSLLCFNPFTIYYSVEFKPYTTDLFWAIILMIVFYGLKLKNISINKLFLLSLTIAASVWCSNTAVFIIVTGLFIVLIDAIKSKRYELKKLIIFNAPILLSIISFYILFYKPIHNAMSEVIIRHWSTIEDSFFKIPTFLTMFQDKLSDINGFESPYNSIFFLIVSLILFIYLNRNYKIILLTLLPFGISLILSFLGIYPFEKRLVLFLFPSFFIIYSQFILYCQNKLFQNKRKFNILLSLVLLIFAYFISITPGYKKIYITSNIREAYNYLKSKNPELKNVISTDELYKYYSGKNCILSETAYLSKHFSNSKIPMFIETAPNDEYWIFIADSTTEYCDGLKQYLLNNKSIKIIDIFLIENDTIVTHFRK
ncbi:hypothetical protein IJ182_00055 [bacterium]|nr:hypothetical protein [bacterium]